jgi:hypothetical protein
MPESQWGRAFHPQSGPSKLAYFRRFRRLSRIWQKRRNSVVGGAWNLHFGNVNNSAFEIYNSKHFDN